MKTNNQFNFKTTSMTENSMNGKKYRRSGFILLAVAGALLALAQCNDTGNTPTTHPALELLFPKGGESFKVGDTVTIRWSVHEPQNIPSVGISYSIDSGKTFPGTQIIGNDTLNHGSIAYPDTDCKWVVDKSHISTGFVLVIWEYYGQCLSGSPKCISPYHDKSALFSIHE
jgi:hypothetical protein